MSNQIPIRSWTLRPIDLTLPVTDVVVDDLCRGIDGEVPADGLDEIAFWI